MPDLLLELRSEEIPARMQRKAAGDLKKLVTDALVNAGLTYEGAQDYWTPRRLTLDIRGLSARGQDVREEIKGPATSAPEQAVQGFLRKAGLSSVADAHVHSDPKKGDFYVAHIVKPGRVAADVVAEAMPKIIREFPWPKSMRWGKASAKPGSLRWVRPLQSIVCLLSTEPEEPVVVEFEVDGIRSGNITHGHRFHAPEAFLVKRFDDYAAKLEKAKVVLSAERRKEMILTDARNLAFASGLELIEDEGLLEEVSGLVEWPVVLMGSFEEDYLAIPGEVIRLTIRANQKCFVTRDPRPSRLAAPGQATGLARPSDPQGEGGGNTSPHAEVPAQPASKHEGSLSNRFILVSNIEAKDGGAEIVHGNGKVVRARLSDAVHFWKTDQGNVPDIDQLQASSAKFDLDLSKPLDQRMARLDHLNVTFHAKLGSQGERVARIAKLAEELAVVIESPSPSRGGVRGGGAQGANEADVATATTAKDSREAPPPPTLPGRATGLARPSDPLKGEGSNAALARRAATLCKADLQTEVVGEFPELQGLMGRKYAELQGEHPSVCAAMEDHYKPQGPSDRVPSDPVAIAVALADKLDTLAGFWAIDEKPTGSKDPYALRRAALGVIRILLERGVNFPLITAVKHWYRNIFDLAEAADRSVLFVDHGDQSTGSSIHNRWKNPTNDFNDITSSEMFISRNCIGTLTINDLDALEGSERRPILQLLVAGVPSDLLAFFHDRLKVYLRDQGARHDIIEAVLSHSPSPVSLRETVLSPGGRGEDRGAAFPSPSQGEEFSRSETGEGVSRNDDLLLIARKVEALSAYINTDEGQNLTAGVKRAANILAAEEKKGAVIGNVVDVTKFTDPLETALFEALNDATNKAGLAVDREDYAGAMTELSRLRGPVDAFLDGVLVNDPDPALKANRLALLNDMKKAAQRVADFSKISG